MNDIKRPNNQSRNPSRDSLERRFDQWIETGRQFVEGVSGTRPGQRSPVKLDRWTDSSLEKAGRWVGNKIDWLLEEDDDWQESFIEDSVSQKKPLEAISRRIVQERYSGQIPDCSLECYLPKEQFLNPVF